MSKVEVYYFSGNGNLLHITGELKRRFFKVTTRGRYHHFEIKTEDIAGQKHFYPKNIDKK